MPSESSSSGEINHALGQLIAGFNEIQRQQEPYRTEPPRCDFCSGDISAGDRVTIYMSNVELSGHIRPIPGTTMYGHRTYCEACDRQYIIYPHEGTVEILFASTRYDDGTYGAWRIRDTAATDIGEPWNAHEAFKLIYGVPLDVFAHLAAEDNHSLAHEDIVDAVRLYRIGIRDIFDEGGNINVSPATKDTLRERIHDEMTAVAPSDNEDDLHRAGHEQIVEHGRARPEAFTCPECGATAPAWGQLDHEKTCSSAAQ